MTNSKRGMGTQGMKGQEQHQQQMTNDHRHSTPDHQSEHLWGGSCVLAANDEGQQNEEETGNDK